MVVYSIKDIEKLTGIKAHTIRIWEKRYAIITPKRTKTNIRYYDEQDLKNILNISFLNENGHKISHIAALSEEERNELTAQLSKLGTNFNDELDSLMFCVLQFDTDNVLHILRKHIQQNGLKNTMESLVFPFLEKMGVMWISGAVSEIHEKFLTDILLNEIITQTHLLHFNNINRKKVLMYLPAGQSHELSLRYQAFLCKSSSIDVVMAGAELSVEQIAEFLELTQVDYLFTVINDLNSHFILEQYLSRLSETLKKFNTQAVVTGYQITNYSGTLPENILYAPNSEEVIKIILQTEG